MKTSLKRIQLIHRTKDGKYKKFWQNIDFDKMFTLEHVWNDINLQLASETSNNAFKFYYYKTNESLPSWYHVNLLNDNDQILIDEFDESSQATKPTAVPSSIKKLEPIKTMSKTKQLKTLITNRSFIITNKHFIPDAFYKHWEECKMHKNTNNCRMMF